MGLFLLENNWD